METNQEKAKELIGEDSYKKLIENGFMPLELSNIEVFLKHQEEIEMLNKRLDKAIFTDIDYTPKPKRTIEL